MADYKAAFGGKVDARNFQSRVKVEVVATELAAHCGLS
jgi:hypothetical protein